MTTIQKVDRSAMIDRMKELLKIEPRRTALITIDIQRGAYDPAYGTLPLPASEVQRVVGRIRDLLPAARRAGIHVIHITSQWYEFERKHTHPFVLALEAAKLSLSPHAQTNMIEHKIVGTPGAELMPGLQEPGDLLVDSKRRFDSFYGTNLEVLLRVLDVDTVILIGANTNTCIQCTAFAAYCRDFKVILASDCVATAYGQDLHEFALDNVRRRLGWVLTNEEILARIAVRQAA